MGDFNGHSPWWGSKTTTDKGKELEKSLTTVLIHIYILGMGLIQLLMLLIHIFF
jgi:hypothetical protein